MSAFRLPLSASVPFCREGFDIRLEQAKNAALDFIDFDICCNKSNEKKYFPHLDEGMAVLKASGLAVNAVHIPFGDRWDPSVRCRFRRKRVVARIVNVIKKTEKLNPVCYVLHGSFEPVTDREREKRISALLSALPEICAATDKYICLEILPRTCLLNTSDEAAKIIDDANIKNLKLCVDVNHFLREKSEEAIIKLGDRIKTLHISDHDYVNERHWLPGKGKIDWNAVLGALAKVGYVGAFNYEVDDADIDTIVKNYETLFDEFDKQNDR